MNLHWLFQSLSRAHGSGSKRRRQQLKAVRLDRHRRALIEPLETRALLAFNLAAGSPVAVDNTPQFVISADLNKDGRADLVAANVNSDTLSVLLGDGKGGFSVTSWPTGSLATASVAAGDLNGDGHDDLVASNLITDNVSVLLGNGVGGFTPADGAPVPVGDRPRAVVIADVNRDGRPDVVTANFGSDDVSILLGDGDGGFTATAPVPVGDGPHSVEVADINGDGRPDLVSANFYSDNVSVLLGDATGEFSAAGGSPVTIGDMPFDVAVADLNCDGRLDIAAATLNDSNVSVLLGDGTGGFAVAPGSPMPAGLATASLVIADFNGDGRPDLAASNTTSDDVSILLGRGDGSFISQAGSPVPVGESPRCIAVADLNNDGRPDLVTANENSDDVTVLLNDSAPAGAAKFASPAGSAAAAGDGMAAAVAADLNGDGFADLVTANADSDNVGIQLGNGSGSFTPVAGSPIPVGYSPVSVAVADFNGDGRPDFATANLNSHNVSVRMGNGDGTFFTAADIAVGTLPRSVAAGDLNRDGIPDLVVANSGDDKVIVLLGVGTGDFFPAGPPIAVGGDEPVSVAVLDLNGDGLPDLATANRYSDNVSVLLGDGTGALDPAAGSPVTVGSGPLSVAVADVNGDGRPDLVTANYQSNSVSVLLGNGDGSFAPAANFAAGDGPVSVAAADLDGDGHPDLATTNAGGDDVSILLGDGAGSFAAAPGAGFAVGDSPCSAAIADWNGDGRLDLATANAGSDNATLLLGDGTGSFSAASGVATFPLGDGPSAVAAGDLNGDGFLDLVTSIPDTDTVRIDLADGRGGFTAAAGSPIPVGDFASQVAIADLDRDGRLDLVISNESSNNVNVFLGDGTGSFTPALDSPFATGSFPSGRGPSDVKVADVNGDGCLDLVTSNTFSGDVSVLLGDGTGDFTLAGGSTIPVGTSPHSVVVADFNGDGRPDLAVANHQGDSVGILLGNGLGGFAPAAGSPLLVERPDSVLAADFNLDGRIDLAIVSDFRNLISIRLGNGSGGFTAAPGSPIANGIASVGSAVADLNGDGRADLITANSFTDDLSVLLGNGDGTFAAATRVAVGDSPVGVAVADLNGDGQLDLVAVNHMSEDLSIRYGQRNAATHLEVTAPTRTEPGVPFIITVDARTAENLRDALYAGTVRFSSSDGSALLPIGLRYSIGGNAQFTLGDDGSRSFTVKLNTPGPQTITVTDTISGAVFGTAVVQVEADPTFTSTPVADALEDEAYSYPIAAADPNGDPLTIAAETVPAWLEFFDFGDGTAILGGTPAQADIGTHEVVLVLSDGIRPEVRQSFTITVVNTNDAPVFETTGDPTLPTIDEDASNPGGTLVSSLLTGAVTDADAGAVQGIAVTAASGFGGAWQYALDGGTSWMGMGSPSGTAALLLPDSALVRLVPKSNFNGTVKLWYKAWDQTEGSIGGTLSTAATSSVSAAVEGAALTITPVNDAPVLDNTQNPALKTTNEDALTPASTSVATLLEGAVTDVDAGALSGVAVTSAPNTFGVWQYSLNSGATWLAMGSPSFSAALLLPSSARIRFRPATDFYGTVKLSYRAWDQIQGTAGGAFNLSGNTGGSGSFSADKETATLVVSPKNDAPVVTLSGTVNYVHDGARVTLAPHATLTDVDSLDFDGGRLRVRISEGASKSNRLTIGGGFTVDASNNVLLNNVVIGRRASNGFGTNELIVVFNSNATPSIAQQLVRAITFKTVGGAAGLRKVLFTVSDGDGGLSAEATKTVNVS